MPCVITVVKEMLRWKMNDNMRTYSELITIPTFEERYEYLRLRGRVGEETFGIDRYLNQAFYKSQEWLDMRDKIITRDKGRCLGIPGREIYEKIIIHHMNPINVQDIVYKTNYLLNPEYLICVDKNTHDAIHYSDKSILMLDPVERRKNDTCPWKH